MPNNVAIILKPLVARPTPHHDQHYTSADIRNGRWNFADRQERHTHTHIRTNTHTKWFLLPGHAHKKGHRNGRNAKYFN